MTIDLETQLGDYWATVSDALPNLDTDLLRNLPLQAERYGVRPPSLRRPPSRWRPAVVAGAAAVLVLAIVGGTALLFAGDSPETANEPLPDSIQQLDYPIEAIPPFRAEIRYSVDPDAQPTVPKESVLVTVSHGGLDPRFRLEINEDVPHFEITTAPPAGAGTPDAEFEESDPLPAWAANAGSFIVVNGPLFGEYQAGEGLFTLMEQPLWFSGVLSLAWEENWNDFCEFGQYEFLPADPVAGRETLRLHCTNRDRSYELSVDAETGLVLRLSGGEVPNPDMPVWLPAIGYEVVTIEYNPRFPDDHFAVDPPAGAVVEDRRDEEQPGATGGLDAGLPAPALRGTTLDGADFDLTDLRGSRVAVLFWGSWCAPCLDALDDLNEAAGKHPDVTFVTVLVGDRPDSARAALVEHAVDLVTVDWADYRTLDSPRPEDVPWGVMGVPHLVLVDRDGTVVSWLAGLGPMGDYEGLLRDAGW